MKSYLIDTHILLWWLADEKKISKSAKAIIANPNNHIFVSAISLWEIAIKKSLKKLKAPNNILEMLEEKGMTCLPLTAEHALAVEKLPFIHDDPFDRLLIAQCKLEEMIFITADKIITQYDLPCL